MLVHLPARASVFSTRNPDTGKKIDVQKRTGLGETHTVNKFPETRQILVLRRGKVVYFKERWPFRIAWAIDLLAPERWGFVNHPQHPPMGH